MLPRPPFQPASPSVQSALDAATIADLMAHVARLDRRVGELEAENAELKRANAKQAGRIKELEGRLGLNSRNSGKPPSTDGLRKGPAEPRRKGGRPAGGQSGHAGGTLERIAHPDRVVDMRPLGDCACGRSLAGLEGSVVATRQVVEAPPFKAEVTEYRQFESACACGCRHRGAFPEGVGPGLTYGPRFKALALGLAQGNFVGLERTATLLDEIYGFRPSAGSLQAWTLAASAALAPAHAACRDTVAAAPVAHFDESGLRQGGKLRWLHVAAAPDAVYYTVHDRRGQPGMDAAGILPGFSGVAVHDHWKAYFGYAGATHALCNAHYLRELEFFRETGSGPWVAELIATLKDGAKAVRTARDAGRDALAEPVLAGLLERYDSGVAAGLGMFPEAPPPEPGGKRRRGRTKQTKEFNLLRRMRDFKPDLLRFLADFRVPFTNNLAERLVRPVKVKLKVIGGFRSDDGARAFAILRSVWETDRLRGVNPFQTLQAAFQG